MSPDRTSGTAAALRSAFDRSFAEAQTLDGAPCENLLAITIAGRPYALRLSEVGSLYRDRKVVPVPSREPAILGIAAFRGTLAPVYDLAALLGCRAESAPRCLILTRDRAPVGLAFEALDGQRRVLRDGISFPEHDGTGHVHGTVRIAGTVRPLIHIASVVEAIAKRIEGHDPPKER